MNDYGKQRFAGTVIGLFLLAAWGCPAEAGAWQDQMMLRWIKVKYEMKEYAEAHDKCLQVLFEYPGSTSATQALKMLTVIQAACKKERGAFPTPPSSFLQPFQTNYTGTQFCSIEVRPNLSPTNIAEIVSGWATPYGQPLIFWEDRQRFQATYVQKCKDNGTSSTAEFAQTLRVDCNFLRVDFGSEKRTYIKIFATAAIYQVKGWPVLYGDDTEFFDFMTNQLQSTIGRIRNKPDTVSGN